MRDALAFAIDRRDHFAIFVDHKIDDVERRHLVDRQRRFVDRFSREALPLGLIGHIETSLVGRKAKAIMWRCPSTPTSGTSKFPAALPPTRSRPTAGTSAGSPALPSSMGRRSTR